jgi:magnesium-transporting ATPase (P-type)
LIRKLLSKEKNRMIDMLINALVAGILGMIAFVVVQGLFDSLDTSTWSSLSLAIVPLIPPVIAIITVVGLFLGLSKLRSV